MAVSSMKFILLALALSIALARAKAVDIDEEFVKVTCGSTIKLAHSGSNHKLHSHGVSYGSGSGQQSVTGFSEADDSNSFWLIQAGYGMMCDRGEPVPCGGTIRLRHGNTKGYLHSHLHQSPLSHQQEVSCYDGQDTGDDWIVECVDTTASHWLREEPIQLKHVDSKAYLACNPNHQYGHPIPGQLEVAAAKSSSKNTQWMAQEGVYFGELKHHQ